jgi:hypothetical protein
MSMEQLVEWELAEETEILVRNLSHCHFVHHKSHMNWHGIEPGCCGGKPAADLLSYNKATFWRYLFRIFARTQTIFAGSLWLSSVPPSKYFDLATTVPSFQKLSITSFLKHPTIRRNIVKISHRMGFIGLRSTPTALYQEVLSVTVWFVTNVYVEEQLFYKCIRKF